jgi:hypothetical protein
LQLLLEDLIDEVYPPEQDNEEPRQKSLEIISINGRLSDERIVRNWHLVHIRFGYNQSHFIQELEARNSRNLIYRYEVSQYDEYRQHILIQISNLSSEITDLLRQIPSFYRVESRPLTSEQVTQMLGRNPNDG